MQQQTGNMRSAGSIAGVPLLSNGWVPRRETRKNTGEPGVPAKVQTKVSPLSRPIHTTLLDLVRAVNDVIDDEQVVVATVAHLVNTHRVRLTGTFKNTTLVIV